MDSEIKTKWVDALSSDLFKQGRTFLNNRTDNTFCCLGVLCEINKIPVQEVKKTPGGQEVASYGQSNTIYSAAMLTPDLLRHFKLDEKKCVELAKMNDGLVPFKDIAKYIQDTL